MLKKVVSDHHSRIHVPLHDGQSGLLFSDMNVIPQEVHFNF
jgi:hypothetical protein